MLDKDRIVQNISNIIRLRKEVNKLTNLTQELKDFAEFHYEEELDHQFSLLKMAEELI